MKPVGLCIPTNNPPLTLGKFCDSIMHLAPLQGKIKFLFNFQPPYTKEDIQKVVDRVETENGHLVDWRIDQKYDKPIKFALMRERAAMIDPELDFYMLCDDDFVFRPSSALKYAHAFDYVRRFPRCGGVTCKQFLGGYKWGDQIKPTWHDLYATNRGMVLRNMLKMGQETALTPQEALSMRGVLDESISCFARMELGYYIAKQMNNPTIHHPTHLKPDLAEDDMHHPNVVANNGQKFIRERWKDDQWVHGPEYRHPPVGIKEMYDANGGIDLNDESLIVDYGAEELGL